MLVYLSYLQIVKMKSVVYRRIERNSIDHFSTLFALIF